MPITVYHYPKCGTCRDAMKWLNSTGAEIRGIHLFDNPPSKEELKRLISISGLDIKKFINVNGDVYQEMNLKDSIKQLSDEEIVSLLASNGRLIKRPIVTDGDKVTVGFKSDVYSQVWGKSTS